jgi:hypothetical protein
VNTLRNAFILLLLTLFGCGQQLVEFPISEPPVVVVTSPIDGSTGVALETTVQAVFSEAMEGATLDSTTFTLTQGNTLIAATVTYAGLTATLTPESPLAAGTSFEATITTGAKDTQGTALAENHRWTFTTRDGPDTTAPTVTFTYPAEGTVNVPIGSQIHAAFSEVMNAATLTDLTFTLTQENVPVPGTVSYSKLEAIFTPAVALLPNTVVTATITAGAQDPAGNALAADYVWSFTTSALPDVGAPSVTFTNPSDGAVNVPIGSQIHAAFSEVMNAATITDLTFTLTQENVPVPGTVTYSKLEAIFTPAVALLPNSVVTATITAGAQDLAGNALAADYVWSFTTSALPDVGAPIVTFTNPPDHATGVDTGVVLQAAFSETMDCATINAATFTLAQGAQPVLGVVGCAGPNATFTPAAQLSGSPTYTATITTGAKDIHGNALLQDYVWSFETGPKPGIAPVALGAASSYAILAFNTVTNVNNPGTMVNGDLGISPGAALVGFPPGQVNGLVHAGDAVAAAAKAALLAAYNDAAGRLNPAVLPADISGLTFSPGLYNNSTSVMHSSGNCTLDAKGNSNAVFIFQMGSTLTTNAATQIVLSGGAKATNVFWAVGTSATLGTNSIFKGTILAATAITMQTGAVLEGRVLAQAAAVSLDTNVITVPAP